ncbi:type VI secretion system lipoprotein TssJ [Paraburkholderia tropica]|uniref:type VI secretion system lipoprotein TssJ n=1 Tax=Paraburkholderia tropica TaxID=92647 RepID=UPI00160133D5|nr:type VI secretion system lipoprotein TssJ [Paraburkholderia tropica]QNB16863.1 type VI secretion system lipoprotein TssJ [Paraburkholderia tropica]
MTPTMSLRLLAVSVAALSAGGCSVLGLGSGSSRDNGPVTQVGLGLYASPDVNPNPDSASGEMAEQGYVVPQPPALTVDPTATGGPYLLNLKSTSKVDLTTQLRSLLDYLQHENKASDIRTLATRVQFNPDATPSTGIGLDASPPYYGLGPQTVALPTQWSLPKGAPVSRIVDNPPLPLDVPGKPGGAPALGQYADSGSAALAQDAPATRPELRAVATPITFKILQLKDDSMFLNAGYDQLAKDLKKSLGSTYIDDEDYVLQPGQYKYIDYSAISKSTRYIAVLANFHNQNGATWKQVLRLEQRGYRYALLVVFRGSEVSIADEGYRSPPPGK